MSYHKRDIAHWNQGKSCKGTRKAKERTFVDREVDEQLADDTFRYRHSKRKPNHEARLQYRIDWYEKVLAEYEREPKKSWRCSFASFARDSLRKAREQLKELQEKKNG